MVTVSLASRQKFWPQPRNIDLGLGLVLGLDRLTSTSI